MSRKSARRGSGVTAGARGTSGGEVPAAATLGGMVTVREAVREGSEIGVWRQLAGLTIAEVSQLLAISPSTWHRWITGKTRPEARHRMRLGQWLERHHAALKR
jgi:hypothetical protein